MSTFREIRADYLSDLSAHYDDQEALTIFQIIVQECTAMSRIELLSALDQACTPTIHAELKHYLHELSSGKPLQYVLGKAPFFGLELRVNEHTLIPRPETEELIAHILEAPREATAPDIIDIGTGSGCIALALKKNWLEASVSAVDISSEAIRIAEQNAARYQLDVNFRCVDILEWPYTFSDQLYDIVVSNPPYITRAEMETMKPHVLLHEPHSALFVENEVPLLFYDYISSFAQSHLRPDGTLYFEINQHFSVETKDMLHKKGFKDVVIFYDINGVPRHLRARMAQRNDARI